MTVKRRGRKTAGGKSRRTWLIVAAVVVAGGLVLGVAFWSAGPASTRHAYALAPESALPARFQKAPPAVREAYRFAIANREVLRQIPCYCGCGAEHRDNADCYIKSVRPDGQIEFDEMSFT
jgi:hypothetical protein